MTHRRPQHPSTIPKKKGRYGPYHMGVHALRAASVAPSARARMSGCPTDEMTRTALLLLMVARQSQ